MTDQIIIAIFPPSSSSLSFFSPPVSNGLEAYLVTSPGHAGSALFERVDPFVFPLDGVVLHDMCPTSTDKSGGTKVFTIAAKTINEARSVVRNQVLPLLGTDAGTQSSAPFVFPRDQSECVRWTYSAPSTDREVAVTVLENTFLPCCICH